MKQKNDLKLNLEKTPKKNKKWKHFKKNNNSINFTITFSIYTKQSQKLYNRNK